MKTLSIKCPSCNKIHDYYLSKPWSPFCSERCQLIDLGAWANEEHRIKGKSIHTSSKDDSDSEGKIDSQFIQ